jgi:hypothetical protein
MKFDIISSQFALHYLFKDDNTFEGTLSKITAAEKEQFDKNAAAAATAAAAAVEAALDAVPTALLVTLETTFATEVDVLDTALTALEAVFAAAEPRGARGQGLGGGKAIISTFNTKGLLRNPSSVTYSFYCPKGYRKS